MSLPRTPAAKAALVAGLAVTIAAATLGMALRRARSSSVAARPASRPAPAAADGGAPPRHEPQLIVVDAAHRSLRLYEEGALVSALDVVTGQVPGCKQRRDDRKTPCGTYYVTDKQRVPASGATELFGGYWMRLNYPGAHDALRGLGAGLIEGALHDEIATAWKDRRPTPQNTALGSGIGFHSFPAAWDWEPDAGAGERPFSYGCVVLHPADVGPFFDRVRVGALVLLQ